MGYSYDASGRLCCDVCGNSGGVETPVSLRLVPGHCSLPEVQTGAPGIHLQGLSPEM